MKRMTSFILFIFCSVLFCSSSGERSSNLEALDEEGAIERLAADIFDKHELLKNKKIGVFDFSSLDGREISEGKKLSKKLLERLIKRGGLRFVERSEINKLLKAQGIEQTGIIDTDTIKEGGKVLAIDVMITGALARVNGHGELSIKAVDVSSGEIYIAASINFIPTVKFSYKEDPRILKLHKESPEKVLAINKTFFILKRLSADRPLIFLMAVLSEEDLELFESQNPRLAVILKRRRKAIESNNPRLDERILRLREGVKLIKRYDPKKYVAIMEKKAGVMIKKRPQGRLRRMMPASP